MKNLSVKFALADSEYLTALRLVAGAVCSLRDIDLDTLEDFKVCVTESALILKNNGFEYCNVNFLCRDGVECVIEGEGGTPAEGDCELSLSLVSALVESCEIEKQGEIIGKVTLKI